MKKIYYSAEETGGAQNFTPYQSVKLMQFSYHPERNYEKLVGKKYTVSGSSQY